MSQDCSDVRNILSRRLVPISVADSPGGASHNAGMAQTDWFVQEWMALADKKQADMIRELGWTRRKASEVYNGEQPYKRDLVNEVSGWLGIEPFELLMPPAEALQLRQLRDAAYAIASHSPPHGEAALPMAADRSRAFKGAPPPRKRAG